MPPTSYLLANDPRAASRPGDMCFGIRDTGVGGLLIIGWRTTGPRTIARTHCFALWDGVGARGTFH